MRPTLFVVLSLAACVPKAPPALSAAEAPASPPQPYRVAVLGDRTGEPDDAVWQAQVAQVARLRPDAVFTVGDLADDAEDEADWARALAPLLALEAAGIEVHHTPGNHDIHDEATADTFQRLTGQAPYRSVDRGGAHWVVLDNSIARAADDLPEAQLAWLRDDLAAHSDEPVVVLMHKPFWATAAAAGRPDPLHELFVAHGVDAVLTGHWHRHAHQRIDGIDYVIVGSSGGGVAGVPSAALGTTPEFLWVTVDEGVHLATLSEGSVRDVALPSLADEMLLHQLDGGGLWATLSGDGRGLALTGSKHAALELPGSATLRWADRVEEVTLPVQLAQPATLPLPRLEVEVDLPDSGPTPLALVPSWQREAPARSTPTHTLDGQLDEWAEVPPTVSPDDWTTLRGEVSTADPTTLWVAYDEQGLTFAARCDDPAPEHIKRLHEGRDGQVVYDDRVGVLLSPADGSLYWIYVSASGGVWDLAFDAASGEVHRDWDATEAAAVVGEGGWSMEARIPWSDLGLEGPPERLGFDARRKQEHRQVEAVFTPAFRHADPERMGVLLAP